MWLWTVPGEEKGNMDPALGSDVGTRQIRRLTRAVIRRGLYALPVRAAAALIMIERAATKRWDEAQAYAWLAGFRIDPPVTSADGYAGDFDTQDYFEKFEDFAYPRYIDSNVRLVAWAVPDTHVPICDFGCGRGFLLRELRARGYTTTTGYEISHAAVQHSVAPNVQFFPGFENIEDRTFHAVCLISVLEHIEPENIAAFIKDISRIASNTIVCCIPVYPNNLADFFHRDLTHRILARRSWWDRQFERVGFVPAGLPPEPLPYVESFVYRRQR